MFFKQFQRRFTSQADVLLSTIYSINTFDENTVKYVLNCDVNTTIGFEKIIYKEGCNNYLSTPVGNNFEIVQEQIDSNYVLELISGMNLYEVSLQKGSIFPLKNDKGIFQNIQNVLQEREKIWMQFLTQKEDKAKEDLIEQYIDYLSGIANPSDALFKRKFQKYVYQLFKSMNYPLNKNSQVKDIEAKIKEPLYHYQLIIGIYAE
ncbi:DNA translocase FtsK, partial [Bacillus paranthracis]|nr:DNA translocase FtsK [Bacillus paranthracis]